MARSTSSLQWIGSIFGHDGRHNNKGGRLIILFLLRTMAAAAPAAVWLFNPQDFLQTPASSMHVILLIMKSNLGALGEKPTGFR